VKRRKKIITNNTMQISRITIYSIFVVCCTARLQSDQQYQRNVLSLGDRICWEDGKVCDLNTTCVNCCTTLSTTDPGTNVTTCGYGTEGCLEDGVICLNETDYTCNRCCNGNYADDGKTCGGTCLERGTVCNNVDNNYTCGLCCDYQFFKNDDNKYECGCIEDGISCIPGDTCYSCCNGAYDNNGTTCGGQCLESGTSCEVSFEPDVNPTFTCSLCCNSTYYRTNSIDESYECGCIEDGKSCIPGDSCYSCCSGGAYDDNGYTCGGICINDGTVCSPGKDCHLCCNYANYWYSTGTMQCGSEPCYVDGEECIPGQSCWNCCSGGAYENDGTTCGGECIPSGSECTYYGTCNKCCVDNRATPPGLLYPIGNSPHWNATIGSLVCGYEQCWEDGTDCIAGYTCQNCCNSTYGGNDKCGGTCLDNGTKCDYYSTCGSCCMGSKYDTTLGYHVCYSYDEYQYPMDDSNGTIATTVSDDDGI
jgi:hypothetical protein